MVKRLVEKSDTGAPEFLFIKMKGKSELLSDVNQEPTEDWQGDEDVDWDKVSEGKTISEDVEWENDAVEID